ncbi:MAG TPA: IS1634 family transposase, partial [Candidatus Dormibacteraeota bacterium]|nr:IS1634 family transposase [Candidatus Dormibacteraeota bacterium]
TERLGPLPLVNHFLARLDLGAILARHVPTVDRRVAMPYADGLGALLRSIVVEREPIYRQGETIRSFAAGLYGVAPPADVRIGDDQLGRALDRLFEADRAALLTEVIIAVGQRFGVRFAQLHNDSTTIRFCGQYWSSRAGHRLRGRPVPWITYGYSKDHRPDLKQLLVILTMSADGGVPVQFRCADGNTNDAETHRQTWDTLRVVAGRPDFLYVADSKLCTREAMDHIDRQRGRFVTVLPRSRLEDAEFRRWLQTHEPAWELVWDRPNPRRRGGPRDRWYVSPAPLPSREAWPVIWVRSSLLALRQEQTRRERLAAATEELLDLQRRLRNARSRRRAPHEIDKKIDAILERYQVSRYLTVRRTVRTEHRFRQMLRGRPGPHTPYRKTTRRHPDLEWRLDESAVAYDRKSDGMYPLLTNDKTLTPAQVLEAHKGQPTLEKRFQQTKTVHEIAPVLLKNPGRIEALFTLYFLALLVQALIERELRTAMRRARIAELPLYPEERRCKRPTTEQVLRLFSHAERHMLLENGQSVQVFHPELTELQKQILDLLDVPLRAFRP